MAREIFVDASAWIALADKNDNWHAQAAKIYLELLRSYHRLATTNLIIAETHIALRQRLGFLSAMGFLLRVRNGTRLVRISSTENLEIRAETILAQYDDQDFSYTDAVSFALMQERDITDAFTYDQHFRVLGFRMVG